MQRQNGKWRRIIISKKEMKENITILYDHVEENVLNDKDMSWNDFELTNNMRENAVGSWK